MELLAQMEYASYKLETTAILQAQNFPSWGVHIKTELEKLASAQDIHSLVYP